MEPDKDSEAMHLDTGCPMMYNGNPDDVWIVVSHAPDAKYAYCSKGGVDREGRPKGKAKNIAAALLSPVMAVKRVRKNRSPVIRKMKKRKDSVGDKVADLLQEAGNMDQLWQIAAAAGLNVPELKARIGHLNPGLQRMGIGNRMRTLQRRGQLPDIRLIWTPNGLQEKEKT